MNFGDKMKNINLQTVKMIKSVQNAAPDAELGYFCRLWENSLPMEAEEKKLYIAVMDSSVPELYIRACGAIPIYLFGGYYFTEPSAEAFFPPISNPAVKTATSMLLERELPLSRQISAVAATADHTELTKALELLKENGYKLVNLKQAFSPDGQMGVRYRNSQLEFVRQLEIFTGNAVTADVLLREAECITNAHYALRRLDMADYPQIVKSFVAQSYYLESDRGRWIKEVEELVQKGKFQTVGRMKGKILLMGSPIYFPNVKVPAIMQEHGLVNYHNFCAAPRPLNYSTVFRECRNSLPELLEQIHRVHYINSRKQHSHSLPIDYMENASGIICHLLKGQLSYAYLAEEAEKVALKNGIPFLSIETDYSDADWEQLRVRLEGFTELLSQRQSWKNGEGMKHVL